MVDPLKKVGQFLTPDFIKDAYERSEERTSAEFLNHIVGIVDDSFQRIAGLHPAESAARARTVIKGEFALLPDPVIGISLKLLRRRPNEVEVAVEVTSIQGGAPQTYQGAWTASWDEMPSEFRHEFLSKSTSSLAFQLAIREQMPR
jgi:hypothetical protein